MGFMEILQSGPSLDGEVPVLSRDFSTKIKVLKAPAALNTKRAETSATEV